MNLAIVLKILSVIGIILLWILGIVLGLLLLVLFFPFSYCVRADGNGSLEKGQAKLWWLFGFLRVIFTYPENRFVVKVLCIPIFDSGRKAKEEKGKSEDTVSEDTVSEDTVSDEAAASCENAVPAETVPEQKESAQCPEIESRENTTPDSPEIDSSKHSGGKQKTFSFFDLQDKFVLLEEKIRSKWSTLRKEAEFYFLLLRHEDTRRLWEHGKKRIGKLFKAVKPRRFHVQAIFSTGSPDTTGYLYGLYCAGGKIFDRKSDLLPDFEAVEPVYDGNAAMSGHIVLGVLAYHGLRLYFSRDLRLLKNRIKRHRDAMDRFRQKEEKKLEKLGA